MSKNSSDKPAIREVRLGATRAEGGTREVSYVIGGEEDLPFCGSDPGRRLVALEICDDPAIWPPVVRNYVGDLANNPEDWAEAAERRYGADLVRLNLTSAKKRGFDAFDEIASTTERVLAATTRPLIIEGSNDPQVDSEVFRRCGEAGEGERLLLGTAEADRYRSAAGGALLAYGHLVIAQSPIDANLAKQLKHPPPGDGRAGDRIVIDPYTGRSATGLILLLGDGADALAALAGDGDLAMPMISASHRHPHHPGGAGGRIEEQDAMAVAWEFYTAYSALCRRGFDRLRPPSADGGKLKKCWRPETDGDESA